MSLKTVLLVADVLFGGMNAAEVMVTSDKVDNVTRSIKRAGTEFQIVVKDAQRMLNDDYRRRMSKSRKGATDVKNSYLGLREMKRFLRRVKREATEADVSLYSMGKSFEGRKMPVVTIREKDGDRKRETKPAIVIDAGIHAREWIAPAMALNIINKVLIFRLLLLLLLLLIVIIVVVVVVITIIIILALNPDNDDEVKDMLQMFDWFIAPIVNPDGYAYSRAKPENRLWRKTRSDKHMNGTGQVVLTPPGANPNRTLDNQEDAGERYSPVELHAFS
nr:hypothetical protein BaRGS_024126 [Batillaria attramentaria]